MTDADQEILAWHWLRTDRKLGYRDERIVFAGETYEQPDQGRASELCKYGMHASVCPLHALRWAPGPIICRVIISGDVVRGADKIVGRRRQVIWMADASDALRVFGRSCALDVAHLWGAPEVVRRWLETGDESLRLGAYSATNSAAFSAANGAANGAAWRAANSAARGMSDGSANIAPHSAVNSVSQSATFSVSQSATFSAARSAADRLTSSEVYSASDSAARTVASRTAWDAARSAQSSRLTEMLEALRGSEREIKE